MGIKRVTEQRIGGEGVKSSWGAMLPAVVSGTTGTVSQSSYTNATTGITYDLYTFTAGSGSITFSNGGPIDVLVVGGGAGGGGGVSAVSYGPGGAGGMVSESSCYVAAGTYATVVGAAGAGRAIDNSSVAGGGGLSSFDDIVVGGGQNFNGAGNVGGNNGVYSGGPDQGQPWRGGGAGATASTATRYGGTGYTSSITNSAVVYGNGGDCTSSAATGQTANIGEGGDGVGGGGTGQAGSAGVVIIRVPR
jgi:hypothetical protein